MVTQIGDPGETPTVVVRLHPIGAIPVNIKQNILGLIGEASHGPAMQVQAFTSSREVTDSYVSGPLARGGQLAFFQGLQNGYFVRVMGEGYAAASYQLYDGLRSPAKAGLLTAANDGIVGNSIAVTFEDGTFVSHDVEYFPGDGTEGPYYLEFSNLVGPWPVANDKNEVSVDGVAFTPVYSEGELATQCVYVDITNGSITFYEGEEPSEYSEIEVNIAYKTKKMTITDGDTTYPAIDNLSDQAAIEAVLMNSFIVNYDADPILTHLPANGTYRLAGGLDGSAIDANDWDEAVWVLRDYLEEVKTGITAISFTTNMVTQDDSYDLISLLEGHLTEMEQDWEPCLGIIGAKENEDASVMSQVVSSHSHRNLCFVANPWGGEQDPPRTNGWIALAAREASLPLGDDSAERSSLNSIKAMQGLLNTYRKNTVRGLQNNRICVLVKEDAGLFPNWSRGVATDWQFVDLVDNRTINYILRMLYAISKRYFFKKNTPDVRADFKQSIAQELNQLLKDYVAVKYILEVHGPGDKGYSYTDNGRVDVALQVENVGHIKRIFVDYGVGIIEDGGNVIYAPNIYSQEA